MFGIGGDTYVAASRHEVYGSSYASRLPRTVCLHGSSRKFTIIPDVYNLATNRLILLSFS
jgi:hypothetical protein